MKVFLLERIGYREDSMNYRVNEGHVIIASSEDEARRIAMETPGNYGGSIWLERENTSCKELVADGESRNVLPMFQTVYSPERL